MISDKVAERCHPVLSAGCVNQGDSWQQTFSLFGKLLSRRGFIQLGPMFYTVAMTLWMIYVTVVLCWLWFHYHHEARNVPVT